MKMTIRNKLFGGFSVVVIVLLVVVTVSLLGMGRINNGMTSVTDEHWPAADAIMEMRIAFLEKGFAHSMIIEGEIDEAMEIIEKADKAYKEEMGELKKYKLVASGTVEKFNKLNDKLNRGIEGLVKAYNKGRGDIKDVKSMARAEAVMSSKAMDEFDSTIDVMGPLFVQLEEEITRNMENAVVDSRNIFKVSRTTLVLFSIFGVLSSVGLGVFITGLIT